MGQDGNREYIYPPALNTVSDKTKQWLSRHWTVGKNRQ